MSPTQPHTVTSQDPISSQYPHEDYATTHKVDETVPKHENMSDDNANANANLPQFSHSKDVESGMLAQEKASTGDISRIGSGESITSDRSKRGFYEKYKVFVHAFIFCLFTG